MKFVVGENGRNPAKNLPRPRFVQIGKYKRKTSSSWTKNGMQNTIKAIREGRSVATLQKCLEFVIHVCNHFFELVRTSY